MDGAIVGPYQLQDCLGHGVCTAVYRAAAGGSECAVKLVDGQIEPTTDLAERLRRDAALLGEIGHPGIIPILEAISEQGMTVAAMPLKNAVSLRELMARGGLDMDAAWSVLTQIAESLDLVHRHGLVYRLLKPANVLVDEHGRSYLAEFGITGHWLGHMTATTPDMEMHAPQYLAPEQLDGRELDYRVDLYALGVLAFELATGTPLRRYADPAEVLRATLQSAPPSAHARDGRLPPEVDHVFQRALAREPSHRQQSVWELLDELTSPPEIAGPSVPGVDRQLSAAAVQPVLTVLSDVDAWLVPGPHEVLDTFFATCIRAGRQVAGQAWPQIAELAGLHQFIAADPVAQGRHEPELLSLSRLAEAFDAVNGRDASRRLTDWGALAGGMWLRSIQPKPPWIAGPPTGRLVDMLSVFIQSLNRVRGDDLHVWTQVNRQLFRVVHHQNMTAVGRRRAAEACHFWRGAYQAALGWAGLTDLWLVSEVECGCVTGTGDCMFTIVRAAT